MDMQAFTLFLYNIAILPVIFLSVLFILLSLINLVVDRKQQRYKLPKELPFISVQVPTFNDPIAVRCIERCLRFDYPKDKYEIIIVDDSTNPETQAKLMQFTEDHPGFVKYVHRTNRDGFKPGALNNAMKITKGEIITVFDADWIPRKDYLKTIIGPFSDPQVAIVQSRQGFYNKDTNIITRFAAYLLMIFHTIVLPISNSVNTVFFCGTAGAIRRKHFEEVGGWNKASITEDSELSVKLLIKGYKTVYLQYSTPSEVPDTFESFVKQQMRWCYGNVRVFVDNARNIILDKHLNLKQKLMILYMTTAHITAPFVLLMTIFGFAGWFFGEPTLMTVG
ncbi:glycosyltransferase, partial [Candidatus Woesearchaeota archaeon]|nr:glycosyltransferase [Candidatus Woesearchaeota archaeon]